MWQYTDSLYIPGFTANGNPVDGDFYMINNINAFIANNKIHIYYIVTILIIIIVAFIFKAQEAKTNLPIQTLLQIQQKKL